MKSKKILIISFLSLFAGMYCGSTEVKDTVETVEPVVKDGLSDEEKRIRAEAEEAKRKLEEEARKKEEEMRAAALKLTEELNKKLEPVTMYGFGNGLTKLAASQEIAWVNKNAKMLKEVADKLPAGFVLEIQGHADSSMAPAAKYVVITISDASVERARYAQSVLVKNGVDEAKTSVVGKGDKMPQDPKKLAINRRVTFAIVPE